MVNSTIANSDLTFDEYIQEGDKCFEQKNLAQAIECYSLAIKLDPNSADSYCKIGSAFLEQKQC